MSLSAGTRIDHYEIIAGIGAGGMGEVYRARDHRLDRDVALKVLAATLVADPDLHRRFEPTLLVRFDDPTRPSKRREFDTDGQHIYFTLARKEGDVGVMDTRGRTKSTKRR